MSKSKKAAANVTAEIGQFLNLKFVAAHGGVHRVKALSTINGKPAVLCNGFRQWVFPGDKWHVELKGLRPDGNVYLLLPHTLLSPADGKTEYLSGYEYELVSTIRLGDKLMAELGKRLAQTQGKDEKLRRRFIQEASRLCLSRNLAPAYRLKTARRLVGFIDSLKKGQRPQFASYYKGAISTIAYNTTAQSEKIEKLKMLLAIQNEHPASDKVYDADTQASTLTALADTYSRMGELELALVYYTQAIELKPSRVYLRLQQAKTLLALNEFGKVFNILDRLAHELA